MKNRAPSTNWNYKYIRLLADEATERAKVSNLRPATLTEVVQNFKTSRRFNIPFLGDHIPDGWERLEQEIFVDTTGCGKPGDPAITQFDFFMRTADLLKDANTDAYGYAVIEQGQTQALIATYRRT